MHGPEDNEAIWRGLEDGTIDVVGTDHIHQSRQRKVIEGDIWRTNPGVPGHETMLPLLLSAERLPLPRIAEVTSTNAARIFGMRSKGSLEPGFDADLTLVDLQKRKAVRASELATSADFTPFEGTELKGWPVLALLRGHVTMRDGRATDETPGRYLRREAQ